MRTAALVTSILALLVFTTPITPDPRSYAQSPAPSESDLTFEVASVKHNKTGDQRVMIGMPPTGRFTATNIPLRLLIRQAYDVQDSQIVGLPNSHNADRYDIVAKAPEGKVGAADVRQMLRALLADRFKMVSHSETREMPIYALMPARSDGKLGAKLSRAAVDCEAVFSARRGGGPPPPLPQPGQPMTCGFMIGPGTMNAGGMPMAELARSLSPFVGRIVLDKTGLTGRYDFQLTYAPEAGRGGGPPGGPPPGVELPPIDPNAPSLFTALQEQLGLKLDSQRGPVDVIVIDRVEHPTED